MKKLSSTAWWSLFFASVLFLWMLGQMLLSQPLLFAVILIGVMLILSSVHNGEIDKIESIIFDKTLNPVFTRIENRWGVDTAQKIVRVVLWITIPVGFFLVFLEVFAQ